MSHNEAPEEYPDDTRHAVGVSEMKAQLGFYKRYFCGCQAGPPDVPEYCPEHKLPTIDYDGAYDAVLSDERLKSMRRKLSMHELRTLFEVATLAMLKHSCRD